MATLDLRQLEADFSLSARKLKTRHEVEKLEFSLVGEFHLCVITQEIHIFRREYKVRQLLAGLCIPEMC